MCLSLLAPSLIQSTLLRDVSSNQPRLWILGCELAPTHCLYRQPPAGHSSSCAASAETRSRMDNQSAGISPSVASVDSAVAY